MHCANRTCDKAIDSSGLQEGNILPFERISTSRHEMLNYAKSRLNRTSGMSLPSLLSFYTLRTLPILPRRQQHCAKIALLINAILMKKPDVIILPVWFWGDDLTSLAWQIVTNMRMIKYASGNAQSTIR